MLRGTAVLLISAQQLLLVCNALPRATWTGTEMQHLSLGSGSRSMLAAEPSGAGGHPSLGSTNAGLCLPICYSDSPGVAQDWATKCTWTKRCTDCPECTGPGFMNTDSNTDTATETDANPVQ